MGTRMIKESRLEIYLWWETNTQPQKTKTISHSKYHHQRNPDMSAITTRRQPTKEKSNGRHAQTLPPVAGFLGSGMLEYAGYLGNVEDMLDSYTGGEANCRSFVEDREDAVEYGARPRSR